MRFHDAHDGAFIINLDRRTDRWRHAIEQTKRAGIKAVRYPALDAACLGISPETACALSHLGVLNLARSQGWQRVLVLEDDVVFCDDFRARTAEMALPDDLEWFYLGAHSQYEIREYGDVWRTQGALATHAYILNLCLYDEVAPLLSKPGAVVDQIYRDRQVGTGRAAYMARPPLATQRPDQSDIQGGWRDYTRLIV